MPGPLKNYTVRAWINHAESNRIRIDVVARSMAEAEEIAQKRHDWKLFDVTVRRSF